jgi:hypothetical protein
MEIYKVNPWDVPGVWTDVSPILQKAIDKSNGETSLEDIWGRLVKSQEILIVIAEEKKIIGALTVFVTNQDRSRTLFIRLLAGEQFASWSHFEKHIEDYARELNCQSIETHVIPGLSRMARKTLNYDVKYHVLVKNL